MNKKIIWLYGNENLELEFILKLENILNIKFPADYNVCVLKNDGAYPKPNRFNLNNNEEVFNNLLSFDEQDVSNMKDTYNDVKDRLLNKIIPFAEDPFGNLICFDYRESGEPTIVFWDHEKAFNNKESAISYVCDSFTDLLEMLHGPKDE